MKRIGHYGSRWAFVAVALSQLLATQSALAASNCFRIYDSGGNLKYESRQAPVDMRNSDSESWTKLRSRGEHMVWHMERKCQGDEQQVAGSTVGRDADAKGNAAFILSRIPQYAGR